jgi:hypothetical protein
VFLNLHPAVAAARQRDSVAEVCNGTLRAAASENAAKPSPGRSPKRSAPLEEPAEEPLVGLFDPLIVAPITGVNALNKVVPN